MNDSKRGPQRARREVENSRFALELQVAELLDLAADPYETKNLLDDREHKELLAQMSEEFDRQVQITEYVVPEYADKVDATPAPQPRRRAGGDEKSSRRVAGRRSGGASACSRARWSSLMSLAFREAPYACAATTLE